RGAARVSRSSSNAASASPWWSRPLPYEPWRWRSRSTATPAWARETVRSGHRACSISTTTASPWCSTRRRSRRRRWSSRGRDARRRRSRSSRTARRSSDTMTVAARPTPMVFVHGGAHGAWCWDPLLPYLDREALAVDLPPKSGGSGAGRLENLPELRTLTIDDFARSVLDDVTAAGFERFVLVGHSMGGLTISEVARRVPDRVEHLVYVSCMVPPEGASAIDALPEDLQEMTRQAVEEARRGGKTRSVGWTSRPPGRCSATTWTRSRCASSSTAPAPRRPSCSPRR